MDDSKPKIVAGPGNDPAVNVIRQKVAHLYDDEPALKEEIAEVETIGAHSKHQRYMQSLMASGKNYVDMQADWHRYYSQLSDAEKHEVWQEFYANQSRSSHYFAAQKLEEKPKAQEPKRPAKHPKVTHVKETAKKAVESAKPESMADLKEKITAKVSADGRLSRKHHLKSLLFGFSLSGVVALIVIFALFNQIFLAPFITPSKTASASPLISDASTVIGPETKLIIPKLNIEAPIMLDLPDNSEKTMQKALEKGVTLYPNTGLPGELSNPTIFGHSSNNIFNGGDYKFIFVRLNSLEAGDTFMINYGGKQYVYRVFDKKIVNPKQVDVLTEHPKPAMATLITCDPPGTSNNRLIVHGEQISPDPAGNTPEKTDETVETEVIPGGAESLLRRILPFY